MPNETKLPIQKAASAGLASPMGSLQREIDRLFEDFRAGLWPQRRSLFDYLPFNAKPEAGFEAPAVDIAEKEDAFELTAEIPGLSEKDVEVKLANGGLIIKGEKKAEKEEKKKDYFLSERRYGAFERFFSLPEGIDRDKIAASFKKGVLTVSLPKSKEARQREKTIAIKTA